MPLFPQNSFLKEEVGGREGQAGKSSDGSSAGAFHRQYVGSSLDNEQESYDVVYPEPTSALMD